MPWADPPTDVRQNTLLAALPDGERERLQRHLQPEFLTLGQALYEPGTRPEYAYFPTSAIVSLEYLTADGASAEFAMVGREGLVGIALFTGGDSCPSRAIVRTQGWAYRLRSCFLREEFALGGPLQHLALLYIQAMITLTAQTAICNRYHSVDQQLCRWLLLSLDRSASSELRTTHEQVAMFLGVRREGVTEAVGRLHGLGIVECGRGRITVVDRGMLEARCCECYGVVKKEFDRLLPAVPPPAAANAPARPSVRFAA